MQKEDFVKIVIAILSIKETEAYQKFNEEDMNQYSVTRKNLPGKDIFKPSNITYEKYLMDIVLNHLTEGPISIERVVFFSNDEIVLDVSDLKESDQKSMALQVEDSMKDMPVPLKTEFFTLHKIAGSGGYYKEKLNENGNTEIEWKCLDNYELPFVLRTFLGEEVTESDKVFYHEGLLAKFIEIPRIEVNRL